MSEAIPRWRADPDYFPKSDARRLAQLRNIEVQNRITARIVASAGDHSYAVVVKKDDMA